MSTRENTIGIVHWDGMFAVTDGEQISLIIPAYFHVHHMPYLNGILETRLRDLFGEDVPFRLDPGDLELSITGASYKPGRIVMTGIPEPWPEGSALRHALDEAFAEAGAIEAEQLERADALARHLRTT